MAFGMVVQTGKEKSDITEIDGEKHENCLKKKKIKLKLNNNNNNNNNNNVKFLKLLY